MNSLTTTKGIETDSWQQTPLETYFLSDQYQSDLDAVQRDNQFGALRWIYERIQVGAIGTRQQLRFSLELAVIELTNIINKQINQILHQDRFKQLESSWQGLKHLVDTRTEYSSDLLVKIKVLNVSWRELSRDVTKALEFDQSQFFQRVYSDEFDTPGGEPFGIILGDYYISHKARANEPTSDVDALIEIGNSCTAALCPFITGASPRLLGMDCFTELNVPLDLDALFSQREYTRWRAMRNSEASRFIGLTVPHALMRSPYYDDGTRDEQHKFQEETDTLKDYVWGNACYAFGSVVIRAFANTGWFADIRGGVHEFGQGGVVENMVYESLETDISLNTPRPATDFQVDDSLERSLSQHGLIPLCSYHSQQHSVFYSNCSLHDPSEFTSDIATANARMSCMIQYMLCVSRFGHYLKLIGRDRIGSVISAQDCQRVFQNWLNQYTVSSDGTNSTIKAKYPLSESRVEIREQAGKIGSFTCTIHLKPHFQLDQLVSSIKLVTELSLGKVGSD
ncbi:type VI secretion system contractile sheath large subunit [Halioxenophilus aromaticivorans]|uniref:Type VI secretion system contractile sheath large subunit n=1 Tax=Halioxenophilus aromaticivorans TaxID=1306992 RepID=A0AAV3U2P7_9ALTE